jgi:hypothetical protein
MCEQRLMRSATRRLFLLRGFCRRAKGWESITLAPAEQASFVIHTLDRTGFDSSQPCADSLRIYRPAAPQSALMTEIPAESYREITMSVYKRVN